MNWHYEYTQWAAQMRLFSPSDLWLLGATALTFLWSARRIWKAA